MSKHYDIVVGGTCIEDLVKDMNLYIQKGWVPVGSPIKDAGNHLMQAVYLPVEDKQTPNNQYSDFEEWMDEVEVFSQRRERFRGDVDSCDVEKMTEWLRTAWELGKNHPRGK